MRDAQWLFETWRKGLEQAGINLDPENWDEIDPEDREAWMFLATELEAPK